MDKTTLRSLVVSGCGCKPPRPVVGKYITNAPENEKPYYMYCKECGKALTLHAIHGELASARARGLAEQENAEVTSWTLSTLEPQSSTEEQSAAKQLSVVLHAGHGDGQSGSSSVSASSEPSR